MKCAFLTLIKLLYSNLLDKGSSHPETSAGERSIVIQLVINLYKYANSPSFPQLYRFIEEFEPSEDPCGPTVPGRFMMCLGPKPLGAFFNRTVPKARTKDFIDYKRRVIRNGLNSSLNPDVDSTLVNLG